MSGTYPSNSCETVLWLKNKECLHITKIISLDDSLHLSHLNLDRRVDKNSDKIYFKDILDGSN